jgi:fluoride ion exporter CrcB/FEX
LKEEKQSHSEKFVFKNTPTFFSTFTNDSFRKLDLNSKAYYFLTVVVVVVVAPFFGAIVVFVGNASAQRIF